MTAAGETAHRYRWHILALCCSAIATMGFAVAGPALCVPDMAREMNLNYAQQGILFSAVMWAFLFAMATAALADRIGPRPLLVAAALTQAAGWWWLGEAQRYGTACLAAGLVGLGTSLCDPLLTPLVCAAFPEHRARMSNLLHAFYCVGLVAAVLLFSAALHAGLSWRGYFRALSVLCLPYGVAAALLPIPRQTHAGGAARLPTRRLVGEPVFWALIAAMVLAGATEMGPTNWLPSVIRDLAPDAPSPAGGPASAPLSGGAGLLLFGVLMGAGRLLTSVFVHRLGAPRLLVGASLFCAAGLGLSALPAPPALVAACLITVGFSVACLWPTLLALAGDRFPQSGASMFSVLSATGGLGCALAPAVIGWMAERTGRLPLAIAALAAAPLAIAALVRHVSTRQGATPS